MVQLGVAREGEVIGEEALQAYISLFDEPLTEERIAAILALFGWQPDALPLEAEAVDGLVS